MSHFSEKLEEYVLLSGLSYSEIAKRAEIDRTLLLKMKKGSRIGNEQTIEKLCDVLMISPIQKEELHRQYLIAKMGDEVYARRELIKSLIEGFSLFSNSFHRKPATGFKERLNLSDNVAVSGREAVLDLLWSVIERENSHEKATISLIAQPEETALMELMAAAGRMNFNLHFEHIICFQHGVGNDSNNRYNIETFRQILLPFISGCQYSPLYFYDDVEARFSETTILPYLLITPECCVAFSKGMNYAHFMQEAGCVSLYKDLYMKLRRSTKPLILPLPDAFAMIDYYYDVLKTQGAVKSTEYSFFPVPCLCFFFNEKIIKENIRSDLHQSEKIAQYYIEMGKKVYGTVQALPLVTYFSEKGLNHFINDGRLVEIPDEYYTSLDKKTCKFLLNSMLSLNDKEKYNPIMIDPSKINMPDNLVISAQSENMASIIYMHPKKGSLAFTIHEPSLNYAMYDFLQYLKTSDLVFTPEQTTDKVRKVLAQND